MKRFFLTVGLFCSVCNFWAQTLKHPVIWITEEERPALIDKINNDDWANDIYVQLRHNVDSVRDNYFSNPDSLYKAIPAFGGEMPKHNALLTNIAESSMLYYITKDESYARYSADVLWHYLSKISNLTPQTTQVMGDSFYDPRTCYNMLATTYDFIYNYLNSGKTEIYDVASGNYIKYDDSVSQKAFANIVGNILQEYGRPDKHGHIISNHPILTAPGALFSILCIEDDKERERLFDVFWNKGTWHQSSFQHTILPMFSSQGIWPESLSYSYMPNISLILNIVDRIKPEMNVIADNMHVFEGTFLFENLRNPDRRFVRYGDSKRTVDLTEHNYLYILDIAKRNNLKTLQKDAELALLQKYEAEGGRQPKISDQQYDNASYLKLFWGHSLPDKKVEKFNYTPTVIIKHAGVALQRNYVEKDNVDYGLCGIIGGAHYVHSHLTGIAMELYGAGYVMGPNAGLPLTVAERLIPLHEHYFRLYAGNNTVVVNGTSHGLDEGSWKGKANVWQNTVENIACEPAHLQQPVSDNFSFATQYLNDTVNNCIQERTLAVVRTSDTTGYYFDMFRSESKSENNFHDYIYHNVGDRVSFADSDDKALDVEITDRYQNDIGDVVKSPGWRFFEDTKTTKPVSGEVKVRFDIDYDNKYMHVFFPAGAEKEFTKAIAPPTREAKNGYVKKNTPVMVVRQKGEAWNRPFVAAFEPSGNKKSGIVSTEQLTYKDKVVGMKVVTELDNNTITDYIICMDTDRGKYTDKKLGIEFEGRFGIVRTDSNSNVSLYIGKGKQLSFKEYKVQADFSEKVFKQF